MASAGATTWPPDTERFFMELSTMITRAQQQRNTTATQFDSSGFFVRRVEEYEITLSVLRASSYEPGFRDLGTSRDLLKKSRRDHMKERAGSVAEISVFPTGISESGLKVAI